MSYRYSYVSGTFSGFLQGSHFSHSQNKVDEFFSLVHFLRIKPLNDWGLFKQQIVDPLKKGRAKAPLKRVHVGYCSTSPETILAFSFIS